MSIRLDDSNMLRIFTSKPELSELLDLTSANLPLLLDLHTALQLYMNDLTPDSPIEVYAYPWPHPRAFAYLLRNKYIRTHVSFKLTSNGTLVDVDKLLDSAPNFFENFDEFTIFSTDTDIFTHISNRLNAKFNSATPSLCHIFYMPIEKQQEVAKTQIALPEGYKFAELDPERDAEFISGTWKHASATEVNNTKSQIVHLPSIAIKYGESLVGFEMLYANGAMKHLYVVPEHRGKGIGTAVELKLCQKLIEMKICPYKFVENSNTQAESMSIKSGLWKTIPKYNSDRPAFFNFGSVIRK